ncbi:DNA polymerase zeta catalytic subunit isoform X4 [Leguminivora glycinivorella]|uniref:DNA polymerase zeta catalytic subunit isoform X4 n=1 Tax=Leguminivora glycinivorella TaxID=1035111 RepID=UPI00200DBA64|nr:DNA polymerase zeta catalytic subunit isoform X4 [Leguminivora glycinivorella]
MNSTNSFCQTKPEFSVRIVVCDHYLTKPIPGIDVIYSDFRGSDIKQVPVLRIFGPTPDGRKACVHVHGVFPYFYIPCPTPNPEPQFLYQIAASLDKALNIALKQASSANQHVYKISLVKGLPFYGFHDKDHLFLKVFLYNPGLIKQAVELCGNGAILGQTFQPHESHLNFTLQFFIDFNLFGMSNIDLQAIKFRKTGISQNSDDPIEGSDSLKSESVCHYEGDCVASHIINRQRIGRGDGIENPGLEEVWNQEMERRKQLNMSLASKSLTQGRIKSQETETHYKFEQMYLLKASNLINKPADLNINKVVEEVYYPAESMEGSQFFKAVDVSIHLPDQSHNASLNQTLRPMNESLSEDLDETLVDESVALNSSLHYSQILLDSEDLELVGMLQDMEDTEKPEEDSIMATPGVEQDADVDSDDAEYSQVFNEDTILLEPFKSEIASNENTPSWHDSFWDGVNIPQLDGTFDDDQPIRKPPTKKQVEKWVEDQQNHDKEEPQLEVKETTKILDDLENSQAIGLNEDEFNQSISLESNDKQDKSSLNNSLQVTMHPDGSFLCFGGSENHVNSTSNDTPALEEDFLTIMLVEVHTSVRGDLNPDPLIDPIQVVFIKISNDCPPNHFLQKNLTEVICVDDSKELKLLDRCIFDQKITYVNTESDLLEKVIELVKSHDPDIITGYEIEMGSWGYLMERAQILGLEVVKEISRITEKNRQKRWRSEENDFEGRIIGRVMFNVWRLLRHELALSDYSFENCMYEILKERVPAYSAAQLATWWNNPSRILRWITVEHYLTRLSGTLRMMEKLDMINRTSELARLFGLQWWEVLSRGSQFRVESLMLRAARPLNLIALSPSVRQRAAMRAPEMLPLIFEPESRFYADPVIVLDFQSLYPSMMIAYNYCFSTCIGRVQNINGDSAYEFGAWRLRIPRAKLDALVKNGLVHWSPVGVGFVKPSVRRGVLPALLRRILAARQAVKKSMKQQTDEGVKKAMHSRQLGLKLIANVTYGYTAANFSGRMPCIEVGDSVVAKGRETLERAIKMVRDNKEWNAKVVYGDTDSMFVQVPGGTREEAFRIGQRIADAVTADNPSPVALKLEKVYQPCILQTKKRYVGYMSESPDQEHPVYEAKGIETVRRDGCPAQVKLLQKSLCELFSTGDLSRVKRLVTSALTRLVDGTMSPQELFFTREYHGVGGYKAAAAAPPNEIAKRLVSRDRRALPRTAWRVSWLVCAGAPGTPLVKLARTPNEVARDGAVPHVAYYAARVLLPPLHRCLSLLGLDVFKWWKDLGFYRPDIPTSRAPLAGSIARYMWRSACVACGVRGVRAVCGVCAQKKHTTVALLANRGAQARQRCLDCQQICESCCGHAQSVHCKNTTCAVLWARISAQSKLEELQDIILHLPEQFKTEIIEF